MYDYGFSLSSTSEVNGITYLWVRLTNPDGEVISRQHAIEEATAQELAEEFTNEAGALSDDHEASRLFNSLIRRAKSQDRWMSTVTPNGKTVSNHPNWPYL